MIVPMAAIKPATSSRLAAPEAQSDEQQYKLYAARGKHVFLENPSVIQQTPVLSLTSLT